MSLKDETLPNLAKTKSQAEMWDCFFPRSGRGDGGAAGLRGLVQGGPQAELRRAVRARHARVRREQELHDL